MIRGASPSPEIQAVLEFRPLPAGGARQGKARQGKARQGKARQPGPRSRSLKKKNAGSCSPAFVLDRCERLLARNLVVDALDVEVHAEPLAIVEMVAAL